MKATVCYLVVEAQNALSIEDWRFEGKCFELLKALEFVEMHKFTKGNFKILKYFDFGDFFLHI